MRDHADQIYKHIGCSIASVRKRCNFTQEELSDKIGISRATLANIEVGRQRICAHYLMLIAANLGVPITDLLPELEVKVEYSFKVKK